MLMGNYANKKEQLIGEAKKYYDKLIWKKNISKSELMTLNRQMKALKEEDALFTTLANRTTSLSNKAKWSNPVDSLNNFKDNYSEFLQLVLQTQS
jgi:hypothetical protein